jgi:hypothetical protein
LNFFNLFIFTIVSGFACAQSSYSFKNLTTQHGLPSNTCYFITQDAEKNIWIATNKGISQFNGVEFKNWNHTNGLPDEDIIYLKEDSKKRMWISTSGGRIFFIKNGIIYDYKFNKQLSPVKLSSWITTSIEDKEGNIWFSSFLKETIKIDKDNQVNYYFYPHNSNNIPELPYGRIISDFTLSEDGWPEIFFSSYGKIKFYGSKSPIFLGFKGWFYKSEWVYKKEDNSIFYSTNNKIYIIKNNKLYDSLTLAKNLNKITRIGGLGKHGIYISDGKTIYTLKENGYKNWVIKKLISEEGVDKVLVDSENNLWINSIHKGVFVLYDTLVQNIISDKIKHTRITSLLSSKNGIIAGGDYGKIFIINKNNFAAEGELTKGLKEGRGRVNSILKLDPSTILISQEKNLYLRQKTKTTLLPFGSKNIFIIGKKLAIGFSNNFYLIPISDIKNLPKNFNLTKYSVLPGIRTNGIVGDSGNFLYLATSEGLVYIDKEKQTAYNFFKEKSLNLPVKQIERLEDEKILAGVDGIGLFIVQKERVIKKYPFSFPFSITINRIRKLNNLVFLCSSTGLFVYIWSKKNLTLLNHIDNRDGLNSNNINDISEEKDKFIIASDSGINFIYKKYFSSKKGFSPYPSLFKVQIDNKISEPNDTIVRPKGSKTLLILKPNTLKWIGNHYCRYRYYYSNTWFKFDGNILSIFPFEGYENKIIVEQKTAFGKWQRIGSNIIIKNEYTWLEKLYYDKENRVIFFVSVLLLTTIVFISFIGIYNLLKEFRSNSLLLLRAEIKPHMLINAISSLQYQYSQGNYEQGNAHIQNYKKFLSEFMKSSDRDFILLEEEISTLKNYMTYECKKENKNISFNIRVENITGYDNPSIPSMIIQPIVENSIKHAFPEMIRHREINILIIAQRIDSSSSKLASSQIECLLIFISDNGKGFDYNRFGTGIGTKSILDKISLLNSKYKMKIEFSFSTVLHEKNPTGCGSNFRIIVPFKNFVSPIELEEDIEV